MRMKQSNIGIAVVGAGPHRHAARAARRQASCRPLSRDFRPRPRPRARAGRAGRRRPPLRRQRRGDQPPGRHRGDRLDAGAGAHRADPARRLQLGKPVLVEKPIGFSLQRRRRDPRHAARDQGRPARRLQPPLQGMLPARQGADAARPARPGRRRHARASTTRARRPSPSSSAIRTRRRCSTCSPITSI